VKGRRFTKPMAPKTGMITNTYTRHSRLLSYIGQIRQKGHFIVIKRPRHQKEITMVNLYAPNVNAPNFTTHTLRDLKAHIESNMVVEGDFNTLLSPIDRSFRQKKINKEFLNLNDTIDQVDLSDVCRIFYSATAQ
jgi:hypothetical protein